MKSKKFLILNYIFIFCIFLLFLNDHFFKWEYSNWITGKLSDFIGILILPFILTFFAPRFLKTNILITGLFFIFWKSKYSNGLIEFYNKFAFIKITRVIDYTDLIALTMLPLSYLIIRNILNNKAGLIKINSNINHRLLLLPSIFILLATSPPKSFYYTYSNGNLRCYHCGFSIPYTQSEIVDKLRKNNIHFDTIRNFKANPEIAYHFNFEKDSIKFYKIKTLIIEQDTLKNVDFSMLSKGKKRTKIYFNGFDYSKKISDEKLKNLLSKYYYKLIKHYIKEKVKK